ncbi:MAG TPA: lysylphosphatidylglycerol synthase transmembrane domain-containing protein [Actinomycetota bacterium]|nr:lysylphosphatidylglycerol synthase transmembrane domain-containing protein [Actinomycetota bacterium]
MGDDGQREGRAMSERAAEQAADGAAGEATARKSSPAKTILRSVLSLVLIAAIFWYLLKDISLADVWAAITAMTWRELAGLAVVAGWNLCTYAFVWMTVTPGLSFGRAMIMTQATTAITNTVPAGSAIGIGMTYAMLGSWGFSRSRTTIAVLVSGVWNAFAKLAIPVLALALVALQGQVSAARITAALLGIGGLIAAVVIFALMLRSERMAEKVGIISGRVTSRLLALIRRPPVHGWEIATVKFRNRTIDLLEHRWLPITAATLVSHLSLYLVLLVCLWDVGVSNAEVNWAEVLAVFAFARLATAVPFTPGGAGVVEAVLITGLTAAGGDKPEVVAAVLVYRALTWALPILVGVFCLLWWRKQSLTHPTEATSSGATPP